MVIAVQRGGKKQSVLDVRREQMETHADGAVAALRDGQDHFFNGLAAFDRVFNQIEKQPRAFRPPHRQREQKVNQENDASGATRQQEKSERGREKSHQPHHECQREIAVKYLAEHGRKCHFNFHGKFTRSRRQSN